MAVNCPCFDPVYVAFVNNQIVEACEHLRPKRP